MPRKLRELKADLRRAGFLMRPGKGSHTRWYHPNLADFRLTLGGQDGQDVQRYQEQAVQQALSHLDEVLSNQAQNPEAQ